MNTVTRSRTRDSFHQVATAALAVTLSTVLLSACSVPLPEVSPAARLDHTGALQTFQSDRVISHTMTELAAADAAKDPSMFVERVAGGAERARAVEYVVAANSSDQPDVIPSDLLAVYGTDSTTWPRVFAGVTRAADITVTPVVLLWIQRTPRAPYQLENWAHMVPGGVVPAMPSVADGATPLALDAPGFVTTPAQAIEDYVALLNAGASSELEAAFAPDVYRQKMFDARTSLSATAAPRSGIYSDTITVRQDDTFVVADAEGGALIFLSVDVVSDFQVPGAQLSLTSADLALLEGTQGDRVVHRYQDLIVMRIRGEGQAILPTVVAADHHLVSVATS